MDMLHLFLDKRKIVAKSSVIKLAVEQVSIRMRHGTGRLLRSYALTIAVTISLLRDVSITKLVSPLFPRSVLHSHALCWVVPSSRGKCSIV